MDATEESSRTYYSISQIFSLIEKHKVELSIESYYICETSLEQVFMSLANKSFDKANAIVEDKPKSENKSDASTEMFQSKSSVIDMSSSDQCILTSFHDNINNNTFNLRSSFNKGKQKFFSKYKYNF